MSGKFIFVIFVLLAVSHQSPIKEFEYTECGHLFRCSIMAECKEQEFIVCEQNNTSTSPPPNGLQLIILSVTATCGAEQQKDVFGKCRKPRTMIPTTRN